MELAENNIHTYYKVARYDQEGKRKYKQDEEREKEGIKKAKMELLKMKNKISKIRHCSRLDTTKER